MIKVDFHSSDFIPDCGLTYVIIGARFSNKWVFIRHKRRKGFELPAGHIMKNEDPDKAAERELSEETGAVKFRINCIATYTVNDDNSVGAGRLYYADIITLGEDKDEDEIEEVIFSESLPAILTFPYVQSVLFDYLDGYRKDKKSPARG
jgi:8-oxo-dGTP diphosphatase